ARNLQVLMIASCVPTLDLLRFPSAKAANRQTSKFGCPAFGLGCLDAVRLLESWPAGTILVHVAGGRDPSAALESKSNSPLSVAPNLCVLCVLLRQGSFRV